jgi:hypothetical protein
MRTATKSKRSLRNRALAACMVAALAVPATAAAMPQQSPAATPVTTSPFPLPPVHRDVPGTDPATAIAPSAVHVIRTVTVNSADNTLPTVLAAIALAIALTGAAYVTLRLRPLARS